MVFEDDVNDQLRSERRQELTPLTIAAGLRAAASEMSWGWTLSERDSQGLLKLADALSSGSSLDGAIANLPDLPEDLREIVAVGVKTGRLPSLLEEYLETNRQSQSLWRGFYLSLLYPVMIVFLSLSVVSGFVVIVVPQFKEIFYDFGVELPMSTMVMISLSDMLLSIWLPMVILFVGLFCLFIVLKFLPFAHIRAKLFHMLPWVGTAQKNAASAEFCSRLAVLIDCQLPLGEALRIVSKTMHDPYFSHVASKISNRVESGAESEDLFYNIPGIPSSLANSFRWARDQETFSDGLRSLAIIFGSQARMSTGQLIFITEPLAITGVGLSAGFIVIAMFAPLLKLLNDLS